MVCLQARREGRDLGGMPWGWEGSRSLTWGYLSWSHSKEMLFTHIQKPPLQQPVSKALPVYAAEMYEDHLSKEMELKGPCEGKATSPEAVRCWGQQVPHPTCPQPENRNKSGLATGEPYLHPHMHSRCWAVSETQGHCLKPERHVPSPGSRA